ncbi:MAG: hydrolase, alpha/beta hydrolase fold family [Acidimicrobiaceae bacterium]|nr:hydrolase, alpha/beta hydrolase fold family [Acidimicrobiaceae bacterium]
MLRTYGDVNLFGESFGDGTTRVLWLHGWARRGEDFTRAATSLAHQGVASVALDLPGFGASPVPGSAGGARRYAELILPAARQLAQEGPLVLVGHSFGGTVATVLASRHPELVASLVLTGAPLLRTPSQSRSPLRYRATRRLHARGLVSDERLEKARQRYGSSDYRRAQGMMREVLVASVNESYETELSSLELPVTLLWGENDYEVRPDVARRAGTLLRRPPTLVVVSGVGHLLPLEAPEELTNAVVKALAQ